MKEKSNKFLQAQVWQFLMWYGPQSPRAVAAAFSMPGARKLTRRSASKILRRLVARRRASVAGATTNIIYKAKGTCPENRRGTNPEALDNLAKGKYIGPRARWTKPGRLFVPKPQHALDAAMRPKA